ncbi:response regulator transcription factor [Desulfurispira natronophila]|uniref:DNA-binding response OmpR family regulator n=1 Tax=Desulfurispira natronophila TaxID=682562 RepID=A0A7W7Y377_9BACT|nr:response regulator transcription factor [Desulfurispira natronophila]MBB5021203.1 DNA-binding response OmpR family regulator [Desulfurispira natronophila]
MSDFKLLKNMNILLAEDDPMLQGSLKQMLLGMFHQVITASNGKEAIAQYDNHAVHIAILDIAMPYMSGMEVAQHIRNHHPDLPIVILTVHTEEELIRLALQLRLTDYLVKPVTLKTLKSCLQHCVAEMNKRGNADIPLASGALYHRGRSIISYNGTIFPLTRNEGLFLEYMLLHRKEIVSAERICQFMAPEGNLSADGLRNLIYRLRRKAGRSFVVAERDLGYKMP